MFGLGANLTNCGGRVVSHISKSGINAKMKKKAIYSLDSCSMTESSIVQSDSDSEHTEHQDLDEERQQDQQDHLDHTEPYSAQDVATPLLTRTGRETVAVHKDIVYDIDNGLRLDVYVPPETVSRPADGYPTILYMPGGAWAVNDKSFSGHTMKAVAERGVVVACVDYRMSSVDNDQLSSLLVLTMGVMFAIALTCHTAAQILFVFVIMAIISSIFIVMWSWVPRAIVHHPTHVLDVARAFRWMHDHAVEYDGNTDRMFVMGHSAGGHLASLLATNDTYLSTQNLVLPDIIRGCITIGGVFSDVRLRETAVGRQLLRMAFGDREHYEDAFPIHSVHTDTPPFLIINAGSDITLKRHTLDMHHRLKQSGVFVVTEYFSNRTHWNIMRGWKDENAAVLDKIMDFIEEANEYYDSLE